MKRFWELLVAVMLFGALGLVPQRCAVAQEESYLTGQFLVATPEMGDPRFVQSVIYMVSHDQSGAMGLVINHPVAQGALSDLLKALGHDGEGAKGTVAIHYGGPVEPERLFILHSNDYVRKDTTFVGNGLAITSDAAILQAIADGKGPRQRLFIFGYAGWGPGQLEAEIKNNAWFSIPAESSLIFDSDAGSKWDKALAKRKTRT